MLTPWQGPPMQSAHASRAINALESDSKIEWPLSCV